MHGIIDLPRHDRVLKPAPWDIEPTGVVQGGRWLWDRLAGQAVIVPLWGGVIHDIYGGGVYAPNQGVGKFASKGGGGTAFDFDASGDWVYLADAFDAAGSHDLTFGALVRPDTTGDGKPWCSWDDTGGTQQWLLQCHGSSGEYRAYVRDSAGVSQLFTNGEPPSIAAGEWAYMVGRKRGGDGALFIDGRLVSTNSFTDNPIAAVDPRTKMGAGGSDSTTQTQFDGQVAAAWATTVALTDEQIYKLTSPNVDRWAPFRPARRIMVAVPASGGTTLTVQDLSAATSTEEPALTQAHTLAVDELDTAPTLETVALVQAHVLSSDELAVATSLESPDLTQAHVLAVQELLVATELEEPALVQAHVLALQELLASTALEEPDLSTAGALDVDDLAVGTSLETLALIQAHVLALEDLLAATSLEEPELSLSTLLELADLATATSLEAPALVQAHLLGVDPVDVATQLETPALTQAHVLSMAELLVETSLENVVLPGAPIDLDPPYGLTVTDPHRRLSVTEPERRLTVTDPYRRLELDG